MPAPVFAQRTPRRRRRRPVWWTTTLVGQPCGYQHRCARLTYLHPFCAHHARRQLGIEVRPSRIHGRGLFATRPFRYGDAIVPYVAERFPDEDAAFRGRPLSPFAFRLRLGPAGIRYDDATALRGYAACVNSPPPGVPANAIARQATLTAAMVARWATAHPEDAADAWVVVRGHRRLPGWRRVPRVLLDRFRGSTLIWLVASRTIPPGAEILCRYHDDGQLLALDHATVGI